MPSSDLGSGYDAIAKPVIHGFKVDADNPTGAPQLYQRVGFVVDRRYAIWSKKL